MTTSLPARRSLRYKLLPAVLILLGLSWVIAIIRSGNAVIDPSGVSMVTTTRPSDGETKAVLNTFISADFNSGHAVDPATLSNHSVRLYRSSDHTLIPAEVSMSAAGDSIVLRPLAMLQPEPHYTFEVTRQLKDQRGDDFLPFTMSFTTGGGRN